MVDEVNDDIGASWHLAFYHRLIVRRRRPLYTVVLDIIACLRIVLNYFFCVYRTVVKSQVRIVLHSGNRKITINVTILTIYAHRLTWNKIYTIYKRNIPYYNSSRRERTGWVTEYVLIIHSYLTLNIDSTKTGEWRKVAKLY